jgi:membrane-bound lytic murein transglycosylase B
LPSRPWRAAAELTLVSRALDRSIPEWRKDAARRARPPGLIVRQALYQQRLTRRLATQPGLGRKVETRVRGDVAADLRAQTRALRGLLALARPVKDLSRLRTGKAEPPRRLLGYYRAAERRFDVRWEVLAAVNLVESAFNKLRSRSYAGAQGPMQFLPSTWEAYGMGGNIRDPRDAIMGAANYLGASGAPGNYRRALFAYNRSEVYVEAILSYARRIIIEPHDFFVYYSWQVYVMTRRGPVRITGPGL